MYLSQGFTNAVGYIVRINNLMATGNGAMVGRD